MHKREKEKITKHEKRKGLQMRCTGCIIVMQINAMNCARLMKYQPIENVRFIRHHGEEKSYLCEADKMGAFETARPLLL